MRLCNRSVSPPLRLVFEIHGYGNQPMNLDEMIGFVPAPQCELICEDLLNRLDDDVSEIAVQRLAG